MAQQTTGQDTMPWAKATGEPGSKATLPGFSACSQTTNTMRAPYAQIFARKTTRTSDDNLQPSFSELTLPSETIYKIRYAASVFAHMHADSSHLPQNHVFAPKISLKFWLTSPMIWSLT